MADITEQDIIYTANELKKLYEYVKQLIIPLQEFETLRNEQAIETLEEQLKNIESEREKVYQRLFKEVPLTVALGMFPGLNFLALAGCGICIQDMRIEGKITKDIYNLAQVLRVSKILLEKYKDKNIEIYPRIFLPDYGCIDMFIKFPDPYKKFAMVALSSVSKDYKVYFSPTHNKLFSRTKKGLKGRKEYKCDKIDGFKDQEIVLRKSYRHLFGSLRESKKPMVKILVLCNPYKPPTEEDTSRSYYHKNKFKSDFPEENLVEIGSKKFPSINSKPTVIAISEEMITDLIDCWLE